MDNNAPTPNLSIKPAMPSYNVPLSQCASYPCVTDEPIPYGSRLRGDETRYYACYSRRGDSFCGPVDEETFQLAYRLANADGYVSSNIVDALCDILKACEKANLSGLQVLEDIAMSINRDADGDNNIVYVSNKFRFKDTDKKTYLDLEQACRCLGLPTTIQVVNSNLCMSFEDASERYFYNHRRPLNAVPIGMSYYIPCCDADDVTSMRMKELNAAASLKDGQYIKLEFVLPYNDSIKEYIPNMEERWENYYCVTNLERPL